LNSLFDDKKQNAIVKCLGIEECVRTNIFFLCSDNKHVEDEKNGITILSALKMATNGLELQSQYIFGQSKYTEFKRCTSIKVLATDAKENYVLAGGDTMLVILLFDKDMQISEFHRIKGLHSGSIMDFEINHLNVVTACPKDSLLSVVQLQNNFQNASTIDFTKYAITKIACPKDSRLLPNQDAVNKLGVSPDLSTLYGVCEGKGLLIVKTFDSTPVFKLIKGKKASLLKVDSDGKILVLESGSNDLVFYQEKGDGLDELNRIPGTPSSVPDSESIRYSSSHDDSLNYLFFQGSADLNCYNLESKAIHPIKNFWGSGKKEVTPLMIISERQMLPRSVGIGQIFRRDKLISMVENEEPSKTYDCQSEMPERYLPSFNSSACNLLHRARFGRHTTCSLVGGSTKLTDNGEAIIAAYTVDKKFKQVAMILLDDASNRLGGQNHQTEGLKQVLGRDHQQHLHHRADKRQPAPQGRNDTGDHLQR
jgi:hypothetical protein